MKNWKLFVLLLLESCGPDPIPDPEPVNLVAPQNLNSCTTASRNNDSTESQVDFQWTCGTTCGQLRSLLFNNSTNPRTV